MTRVLKVRGAVRMHTGTLNYLGSQERLLWGSWAAEAWREAIQGEETFRRRPGLLTCKLTPFTDGDDRAEVTCHAGDPFVQEGHGTARRPQRRAWPPVQRGFCIFYLLFPEPCYLTSVEELWTGEWGDFTAGSKFIINLLCGCTEIPSTLWSHILYLKGGIGLAQCFSPLVFFLNSCSLLDKYTNVISIL